MAGKKIIVKGANENNLKKIDVEIPRDKMVVITGLSGSGKRKSRNREFFWRRKKETDGPDGVNGILSSVCRIPERKRRVSGSDDVSGVNQTIIRKMKGTKIDVLNR